MPTTTIYDLPTPALLLDADILERNIKTTQGKANKLSVSLRPHIKTHKCIEIAQKQKNAGAKGITVSTFYEAEQFAKAGFTDITWAFPIPPVYIEPVLNFDENATLRVVLDSMEAKDALEKTAHEKGKKIHVWLKVDCGYHRAGVDPKSPLAEELVKALATSDALHFDGILSHSGHAYNVKNSKGSLVAAEQERDVMVDFAERMRKKGYDVLSVSIGSTPAVSAIQNLKGVKEIRPGNYAFYDYTQAMIGSCSVGDCALTVLSSVISHQPGASHFLLDAGALALSKDMGPTHVSNDMDMGVIYDDYERKRLHAHIHLRTLSQEHGKVIANTPAMIEGKFKVGDKVRILEHHSCLTAAQFDEYYVVKEDRVVDKWKILRGRS
ncbi:MAG: alanine racemase [Ignavibacteriae bacterium]|nr:alanine racemase [Ignavibacteriota bacterium]